MRDTAQSKSNLNFVLGVVGSDVHCIANQLFEREFRHRGYNVINLGVALTPNEILESIEEVINPVLLLGTLNGDIEPIIATLRLIREDFGGSIPVIVGGNLVLGENGKDRTLDLVDEGASLVIKNGVDIGEVINRVVQFIDTKVAIFSK